MLKDQKPFVGDKLWQITWPFPVDCRQILITIKKLLYHITHMKIKHLQDQDDQNKYV